MGVSMMPISQLIAFSFSAATLGIINMKPNPGLLHTTVIELPFSTQSCTAGSDAVTSPLGSGLSTARSSRTGFLHVPRRGVLCTPSPLIPLNLQFSFWFIFLLMFLGIKRTPENEGLNLESIFIYS